MFKLLILIAAISATAVALFQWAGYLKVLGPPATQVAAQHWPARIGNTIVAAVLWYVWFSI